VVFISFFFDFLEIAMSHSNSRSSVVSARLSQDKSPAQEAPRSHLYFASDAAGFVFWKPEGLLLYEKLRSFIRKKARSFGAQEVKSPILAPCSLFERSGHLAKYREGMFFANAEKPVGFEPEGHELALRPMSCPNHISIYASERRSWRDLPLRLFEFGEVFRDEPSGSLQSLLRCRQFCQDDWHVFLMPGQELAEAANWLAACQSSYAELGFENVDARVSLRPDQRLGSDEDWDRAEEALRAACSAAGLQWEEEPGGGAFYGPKIELHVRDGRGRSWQMGVFQLDCALPERFGLEFDAPSGKGRPALAHAAILGSMERMIGVLLESHGLSLPLFLRPREACLIAVSEKSHEAARAAFKRLQEHWPDAEMDISDGPLGGKIARAKSLGRGFVLVVGEQEARESEIAGEPVVSVGRQRVKLREWLASHPAL